jgi:hypothetical protein
MGKKWQIHTSFAYAETTLGELWRESTLEEPLTAANNINQYQRKKTLSFVFVFFFF